jgi:hypothetical protein
MKNIKAFFKTFDSHFLALILFSSAFIAFLLVYFYGFSTEKAIFLAPVFFLLFFFGLIAVSHILSFLFRIFDKNRMVPGVTPMELAIMLIEELHRLDHYVVIAIRL